MFDVDTRFHNVPVKVTFPLTIEFINCLLIMNVIPQLLYQHTLNLLQTLKLKEQDYLGEATCVLSEVNLYND